MPSFSHSTQIANPLFPISEIHSSLLLGEIEGEPLRIEITLLPETKFVEWEGRRIEVLESQFVAYLDGRIHEVATDLYRQGRLGLVPRRGRLQLRHLSRTPRERGWPAAEALQP